MSPELIRISSWLEVGRAVLTPVPDAWSDITPVVEDERPKEVPEEECEDVDDEEVVVLVDELIIALLVGIDTIYPEAL